MPDTSRPAGKLADSKCPVCGAGFRGVAACPRCGTNLQTVMRLAARAWALRNASRAKLRAGDLAEAIRCSNLAWELQHCGAAPPRVEILLKVPAERSLGVAAPPGAISDHHGRPAMLSIAGIATSSGTIVEPRQTASDSDAAEALSSPQLPTPANAKREAGASRRSWLLATALTLPALFWIGWLMLTRQTPPDRSAAPARIVLLLTLVAGAALYWRGGNRRRPTTAAIILYTLSQALWLVLAGLLIAGR